MHRSKRVEVSKLPVVPDVTLQINEATLMVEKVDVSICRHSSNFTIGEAIGTKGSFIV